MSFAPQALIDHAALRHNLRRVRQAAPNSRIWAVIKADAYGHGMQRVARALEQSDGYAVARVEEGLRLREAGFDKPILVLGGCHTPEELARAARQGLELALHQHHQLNLLDGLSAELPPLTLWLKVDTGMHRLGFEPGLVAGIAERMSAHPRIGSVNLLTHLANADEPADNTTALQIGRFDAIGREHCGDCSIANSAGILAFDNAHRDWVRPGIMLYGVSPFVGGRAERDGLLPVMTLRSRVVAVKQAKRGDPVGYGGRYRCPEDMPIAVVAAGYGDGYPRHAADGTPVLVGGRRLPLIGRVSMDMITLDARGFPDLKVGEEAILWGRGLPAEEVAEHAGTIAYQLFCNVSSRVAFIDLNLETEAD